MKPRLMSLLAVLILPGAPAVAAEQPAVSSMERPSLEEPKRIPGNGQPGSTNPTTSAAGAGTSTTKAPEWKDAPPPPAPDKARSGLPEPSVGTRN